MSLPKKISLLIFSLSACIGGLHAANVKEEVCTTTKTECYDAKEEALLNFGPCPVDDCAFTDYQKVDLESFVLIWQSHLKRDNVPSITSYCDNGTAAGCEHGSIDWTATGNKDKPRQVVIDTDFQNEVDDYFAVAWALLSSVGTSAQVDVVSIIAAPFSFRYRFLPLVRAQELLNDRISGGYDSLKATESEFLDSQHSKLNSLKDIGVTPKLMIERENHATWCPDKGMEESYTALVRFVKLFRKANEAGVSPEFSTIADTPVFRGQPKYVTGSNPKKILSSPGVDDLIARAKKATVNDPLFVISIGAPTNVASALLIAPEIVSKIVLVWDAGYSLQNRGRVESDLNLDEDLVATRVVLESGVRMLYFPISATNTLQLSSPDVEAWYKGQGVVSDALYQRYNNNPDREYNGLGRYNNAGTTRIMWDVSNFLPFILPNLLSVGAVPAPKLQKVETVPGTCHGYESIGTTCKAYYPFTKEQYLCKEIDQYNHVLCNDGFFVNATKTNDEFLNGRDNLVEARVVAGLPVIGGMGMDLLHKLQAAGL
mmetsp:Transcript_13118/g.14575  ORF Transcript_13118/g.14575 Transcript_13118/m.14575 type:complete len:542 (-) Transcript_13118:61-1686(-)